MPEEVEIINPAIATFVTMDGISRKLTKLINITIENQKLLSRNELLLGKILEQQLEEADEGEFIRRSGTVTTISFVEINTIIDPGHPVKGYAVTNDGPNPIYVAHNVAISSLQPDTVDVTSDISRFNEIAVDDTKKFSYNRRKIRNIYLLARNGNSSYRIWLVW